MNEPSFPLALIATWLSVFADMLALAFLWLLHAPIVLKIVITGILLLGLVLIVTFYLGRRYQNKHRG